LTGSHAELIKNPDGAYSQLLHLQELSAQKEAALAIEQRNSVQSNDSRASFEQSMPRTSSHNLSQSRSLSLSFRSNRSAQFFVDQEKAGTGTPDNRDVSIMRLACLNKQEAPVLLLGTIVAAVHGVILPVFGLLLSTAIKIFFEPPHQLRKDSSFWGCIFALIGAVGFFILPIQYYLFGFAGGKLIERIRSLCFKKILHQEIAWFDEPLHSRYKFQVKCFLLVLLFVFSVS
jgi:ATP-binding cassette, subfamily B (MDR/TAP), member 1